MGGALGAAETGDIMEYLAIPAVIIAIWIVAARCARRAERKNLASMDDNTLSMESHFSGRPDNKFARELELRKLEN